MYRASGQITGHFHKRDYKTALKERHMFFIFSIVTKIELYEVFYGKTIFRGKLKKRTLAGNPSRQQLE